MHKHNAARRGIDFLLTFEEWLSVWTESGHLSERGKRRDQYCMARFDDVGPYAVGNVEIILSCRNVSEAQIGKPKSDEHKQRVSKTKTGTRLSEEHKIKIGQASKGNTNTLGHKLTVEHKRKISEAGRGNTRALGHKRTKEQCQKMSETSKLVWAKRKNKTGSSIAIV